MKLVNYDKNGRILGWYDDTIHKKLPTDVLEVEDEVWNEAISINANYIDIETKKVCVKDFRTPSEKEEDMYKAINKAILHMLDSECVKQGFTGDDKTRPYRAIANYVGYPNCFRDKAEKLGAWIADVFNTAESIKYKVEIGEISTPTVSQVLEMFPEFTEYKGE